MSSAVMQIAATETHNLAGKPLAKEDILRVLDQKSIPLQGARVLGNIKTLTQIAAISLRYSIKPVPKMPDGYLEVEGLDGETLFAMENFTLTENWITNREFVEPEEKLSEEELDAVEDHDWKRDEKTGTEYEFEKEEVKQEVKEEEAVGRGRAISKEVRGRIIQDLVAGHSAPTIAAAYSVSPGYVNKVKAEEGLTKAINRAPRKEKPVQEQEKTSRFDGAGVIKPIYVPETLQSSQEKINAMLKNTYGTGKTFDATLEQLRDKNLAENTIKLSGWRGRLSNLLRSVANRVEGSHAN